MTSNPKLFISYSWTSPAHEKWVLGLAEELVGQGIDVIIDKWNLKPGHDAIAFMESMVADTSVSKVLMICDRKYAEKSDARSGGAGTEAQIITPALYEKREQDKFAAVVRELNDDGSPCLPTYYKGRIYFDLNDDSKYAEEFEGLVRWAWDKPAFVKPDLGKKPAFVSEEAGIKISTTPAFRRAHEAIRSGRDNAEALTIEYLNILASEMEEFRTTAESADGEPYDEVIVNNISSFIPYRNEFVEIIIAIAMYNPSLDMAKSIHHFFENIEKYTRRPENISTYRETDFDNFKFILHELFLYTIGILLKYERFELSSYIINTEYYIGEEIRDPMQPYTIFRNYLRSMEARGSRLRRLSSHADLLKERCEGIGVEFRYLMAADLVLYLRACGGDMGFGWWPETLLFTTFHTPSIEIFARAKSRKYFDKIAPMLAVSTKNELVERISRLDVERIPRWRFERINLAELARVEDLATTP